MTESTEMLQAMLEQWGYDTISYANELTDQCLASDDLDEVAALFATIERATLHHQQKLGEAREHLIAVMRGHGHTLYDSPTGRIEVRSSKRRRGWKWDDLLPAVVGKVGENRLFREATGELEAPEATAARLIRECVGFSSGKVTGLRKYGLDPDEYAEGEGETAYSVSIAYPETGEPW